MQQSHKFTLLTGTTGLVGRYLLKDLSLRGRPLAVLIRPTRRQSSAERLDGILRHWELTENVRLQRPVLLEGDLHAPRLGLDESRLQWIRENCDAVIHSAANVEFTEKPADGEPWTTNVEGTRHVLELCRTCRIEQLHHISTAYVCGTRHGVVGEEELDCGQSFRNEYERSKFLAEQEVRKAEFLRSVTIYRPPFIAGDSRTGYTSSYHGLFYYLRLIAMVVGQCPPDQDGLRRVSMRLACPGTQERNCVPIDWVSAVIVHLFNNPAAHGHTFHLAGEHRITPIQIVDYASTYYHSTPVQFGQPGIPDQELNELERLARDYMKVYEPYEWHDPTFDTTNLDRFAPELPCPRIDRDMLHRFIEFGQRNGWGNHRRRQASLKRIETQVVPIT